MRPFISLFPPPGLFVTLILFLLFSSPLPTLTINGVFGALYVGAATVASHYLMTLALGYEDAAVCSIIATVEIPATYILEFFVFSKGLTLQTGIGAVLALGAVISVSGMKLWMKG